MSEPRTGHDRPRRPRTGLRSVLAIGAVAGAVLATAACGDADSSTGAQPAGGSAASAPAAVASAQAVVDQLLKPPTSLGVTESLKQAPAGGTFVYLACELALCQILNKNMNAAADAAGLEYKSIPIKSADPATLIAGMQQALALRPAPIGVSFAGLPEAVWSGQVPAFEAAGVPLIPVGVGETSDSPVIPAGSLNGPADITAQAKAIASFLVTDSGGQGKALVLNVPDIGAFKQFTGDFSTQVTSACPGCAVKQVDVTLAQTATNGVVPAVVAALQRDPSIDYVVTVEGEWTRGVVPAAKAAGRSDIKVIGINPTIVDLQAILAGTETAFVNIPLKITSWKAVDVALRYAQGMPIADGGGPTPYQLLTKETIRTPEDSVDVPSDYAAQFRKLWGLA
ncbi:substrate-binding domain-containing protein [Frankia sp. CN7]|uniref:Substrate-binding domain-containing protein n=1 Tax=Frankia nepalensis TaxID=1836974 RepID=A0A937ULC5_9ACTN|nr:substrate-binding domain-containing protein [Frankia nepalensis]MBL7516085.1 substrate-binding domain-containing protein [Frankia nepalensis]MBL7625652.1 substrate-binding domain-containing protein [Frankia nepalensis]